jgi:hypothetical protein
VVSITATAWDGSGGREAAVRGRREDLHLARWSAADVDGVAARTEIDTHEAVADRDRLLERVGRDVDDVQSPRREIASRDGREQLPVRAHDHPQRTIVHFQVGSGWPQRLPRGNRHGAVGLHPDEARGPDGKTGPGKRLEKQQRGE